MQKFEQSKIDHNFMLKEAVQGILNNEPDMFIVSKEGYRVYTQRSLLILYSSHISSLLSSVSCCVGVSISLPTSFNVINNLLQILKKGVVRDFHKRDLEYVKEAADLMGIALGDYKIRTKKKHTKKIKSNKSKVLEAVKTQNESGKLYKAISENIENKESNKEVISETIENKESQKEIISDIIENKKSHTDTISDSPVLMNEEHRNIKATEVGSGGETAEVTSMGTDVTLSEVLQKEDTFMGTVVEEANKDGAEDAANYKLNGNNIGKITDEIEQNVINSIQTKQPGNRELPQATSEPDKDSIPKRYKDSIGDESFCKICDKMFKSTEKLRIHEAKLHKNRKRNASTLEKFKIIDTTLPTNDTPGIIDCKYCGKVFRSSLRNTIQVPLYVAKAKLQKHLEIHKNDDNNKASSLKSVKSSQKPGSDSIPLTSLGNGDNSFSPKSSVNLNDLRKRKLQKYGCKECSKIYATEKMFELHQKTHLQSKKPMEEVACNKCDKTFTRKDKLGRHLLFHDAKFPDSERISYKCDICDKCFAKKDKFHLHQSYHSINSKNILNDAIPKESNTINDVLMCNQCDKEFNTSDSLEKHVQMFHKAKTQKTININNKNQSKISVKSMDELLEKKDSEKTIMDEEIYYTCDNCSKSFTNKYFITHKQTCNQINEIEKEIVEPSTEPDTENKDNNLMNGATSIIEKQQKILEFLSEPGFENNDKNSINILKSNSEKGEEIGNQLTEPVYKNNDDNLKNRIEKEKSAIENYLIVKSKNDLIKQNNSDIKKVDNVVLKPQILLRCDICDVYLSDEKAAKIHENAHKEEMVLTVRMPVVDIFRNNVLCYSEFS